MLLITGVIKDSSSDASLNLVNISHALSDSLLWLATVLFWLLLSSSSQMFAGCL